MTAELYAYSGGVGTVVSGGDTYVGLSQSETWAQLEPSWTPQWTLLGGQPSVSISFGWGRVVNRADSVSNANGTTRNPVSRDSGPLDIAPEISLSWSRGAWSWMTYLTGNLPTGSLDPRRNSNLTLGHFAFDGGGGLTWSASGSGWEASAVAGFTLNATNPDTRYKSGLDSHLDWEVSWHAETGAWQLGIAGYLYWQLIGDSGSGAAGGPFKSRVVGLGPEFVRSFTWRRRSMQANLRACGEVWARNRPQGVAAFATLAFPLGTPPR